MHIISLYLIIFNFTKGESVNCQICQCFSIKKDIITKKHAAGFRMLFLLPCFFHIIDVFVAPEFNLVKDGTEFFAHFGQGVLGPRRNLGKNFP